MSKTECYLDIEFMYSPRRVISEIGFMHGYSSPAEVCRFFVDYDPTFMLKESSTQ